MTRHVHRTASGAFGWHVGPTAPSATRIVCEIVTPCPECATRGGVNVAGDGRATCANCGARLLPVQKVKGV